MSIYDKTVTDLGLYIGEIEEKCVRDRRANRSLKFRF